VNLLDVIRASRVGPNEIWLEVTEQVHASELGEPVAALREAGVRRAGRFRYVYSSLTYLQRFPVEVLKIDRSFVAGMTEDAALGIVRAIIAVAGNSLTVVAGGYRNTSPVAGVEGAPLPLGRASCSACRCRRRSGTGCYAKLR
jgi:sensor c-di-GMP phosphodiesterase-like protein